MYALKSYFLVIAEAIQLQQILDKYPELKIADAKVVTEADEQSVHVLEVTDDAFVEKLQQEFASQQKDFWKVPEKVDFSVVLPQKDCNSFVLPVYGNFRDASCWAEKWQEASWKETSKFYPVLISCHKTEDASWVEFRGHTEMPDDVWFDNVRKICKHFTKSVPTFFLAEKIA